jgi:hypothetical protein
MSLWTDIRHPVIGGIATGGPIGAAAGLGYDALAGDGLFYDAPTSYLSIPDAPAYVPGYNAGTEALTPEMEARLKAIRMDTRGLDKYRNESLREGPSTWARLASEQSRAEEAINRERLQKGAIGQARSNVAGLQMRGGATSGARERAMQSGGRDYLDVTQQSAGQGAANRMGISAQDEVNRQRSLAALPGMEVQALQPEFQKTQIYGNARQADLGNLIQERARQNAYNMQAWQTKAQSTAAENQARAVENSGK